MDISAGCALKKTSGVTPGILFVPKMVFSTGYIPTPVSDNFFLYINFKCITGNIIDMAPLRSYFNETLHRYHEDTKAPFSVQSLLYLMRSILISVTAHNNAHNAVTIIEMH